mgnify:CR=1 FL=1
MDFEWWHWIVLGLGLVVAELAVPAFFIIWFGLGALLVGLVLLVVPLGATAQIALRVRLATAGDCERVLERPSTLGSSPSRPSEEDKRLAFDSKASYFILSLSGGEPVLNSFHVSREKEVTKEDLRIR